MCGIVGYVGRKQVVPLILDGLKRLEYRGYDSAGIAVAGNGDGLQIRRAEGKLRNLEEAIRLKPLDGTYGIAHTRWATHGRPTEENAHPHCLGRVVVVHNGSIENYGAAKGGEEFPCTVQAILQEALQLRDRREQGQISDRGVAVARGRLEARLDRTLQRRYRSPRNRRLANHLFRERDALFTFLSCPGLEATNWRAEQAIRPMVVTRKVWGGNRTTPGARTQSVLVSILQTCRQQLRSASSFLQTLVCSSQPKVLDLTAPTR